MKKTISMLVASALAIATAVPAFAADTFTDVNEAGSYGWAYEYVEDMGKENPNLSYQFVYDFSDLLEDRLVVGGYRLAYVLNMIFG